MKGIQAGTDIGALQIKLWVERGEDVPQLLGRGPHGESAKMKQDLEINGMLNSRWRIAHEIGVEEGEHKEAHHDENAVDNLLVGEHARRMQNHRHVVRVAIGVKVERGHDVLV